MGPEGSVAVMVGERDVEEEGPIQYAAARLARAGPARSPDNAAGRLT
jgi:hypothetical protein